MAKEIQLVWDANDTLYILIFNSAGLVWNGASFVSYWSADPSDSAILLTVTSPNYIYYADFPTGIEASGKYLVCAYEQYGDSPSFVNDREPIATISLSWTGRAEVSLDDLPAPVIITDDVTINTGHSNVSHVNDPVREVDEQITTRTVVVPKEVDDEGVNIHIRVR